MKDNKCSTCPGCKRHCTADCVRCKYGRAYFSKIAQVAEKQTLPEIQRHKHKWEKNLECGGLVWRFLMAGKRLKKALRKGKIKEDSAFRGLSPEDLNALAEIIRKIEMGVPVN